MRAGLSSEAGLLLVPRPGWCCSVPMHRVTIDRSRVPATTAALMACHVPAFAVRARARRAPRGIPAPAVAAIPLTPAPGPCFSLPRPPVDGRPRPPLVSGSSCGLPAAGMRLGGRRTTAGVTGGTGRFSRDLVDRLLQGLARRREEDATRLARRIGLPAGLDDLVGAAQRKRRVSTSLPARRRPRSRCSSTRTSILTPRRAAWTARRGRARHCRSTCTR